MLFDGTVHFERGSVYSQRPASNCVACGVHPMELTDAFAQLGQLSCQLADGVNIFAMKQVKRCRLTEHRYPADVVDIR